MRYIFDKQKLILSLQRFKRKANQKYITGV